MTEITPRIRIGNQQQVKVRMRVTPALAPMEIELQNTGAVVQWRYVGQDWQDLIAIDDINASVAIGDVETLPSGTPAYVTNVGTAQNVILNFGIPTSGVTSVNGEIGDVVLDADDIDDTSTTNKFATTGQLAKVDHLTVTQAVDLDDMEERTSAIPAGGAAGQVLKKASGTDFDTEWGEGGNIISANTTLNVPGTYATIEAAYAYLDDYRINSDATVTIQVADGTLTPAAINIRHVDSARIRLRGNTTTPANCILEYDGPAITAFYVGPGHRLDIDGFTIRHVDSADRVNTIALLPDEGGYIDVGGNMVIDGFFWNLFPRRGGVLRGEAGGQAINGGDANILVHSGGVGDLDTWTLTGADDALSTLGSGAVNEGGSLMLANCVLNGNKRAGLHQIDGYTRVENCDFSLNDNNGISLAAGFIDFVAPSTAGGNGAYGFNVEDSSFGMAPRVAEQLSAGSSGANATALFKPFLERYFASQPGLRVTSSNTNESARYDSKGSGAHFFNANGGLQFAVNGDVAGPANHIRVRGATAGNRPNFFASGSDANIDVEITPKGTGRLRQGGNVVPYRLEGTATFDPASLADAAGVTTTVTVSGATLGDMALASFSNALQGITVTAWVSAADTVSVRFQNESGGTLDLASGTLKAWVLK